MPFYEKGNVRVHYEEAGAGFPLMVIPGGGLNSTVAGLANHPFNPLEEFNGEYRVIAADLRNANGGQSSGPLEIDRPWDAYTDDHIGLMDHLGIRECMVLGFCIGGPFIWNLIKRAPDRIVAAVLAQPSGFRPTTRATNCWLTCFGRWDSSFLARPWSRPPVSPGSLWSRRGTSSRWLRTPF